MVDMVWDSKGSRLFFGDDQGRIAVSYMPKVRPGKMEGGREGARESWRLFHVIS